MNNNKKNIEELRAELNELIKEMNQKEIEIAIEKIKNRKPVIRETFYIKRDTYEQDTENKE